MEHISLDGYCLGLIKRNTILREKRLVLSLTQGIIKYSKPLEFTKSHSIYFLKSTVDI